MARVEGVPENSPEARLVLDTFASEIKKFYLKQRGMAELSGAPQVAKQQVTPDLKMRYVSNQGDEQVTVQVSARILREAQKQVRTPWDWALLKIWVPSTDYDAAHFRALRTIPRATEPGVLHGGYVHDSPYYTHDPDDGLPVTDDGLSPPVMRYPSRSTPNQLDEDGAGWYSTLAIDLTRFNTGPAAFEIDGCYDRSVEYTATGYNASTMTFNSNAIVTTNLGTVYGYSDNNTPAYVVNPDISTTWPFDASAEEIVANPAQLAGQALTPEDVPAPPWEMQASPSVAITAFFGGGGVLAGLTLTPTPQQHFILTYHTPSGLLQSYQFYSLSTQFLNSSFVPRDSPYGPYSGTTSDPLLPTGHRASLLMRMTPFTRTITPFTYFRSRPEEGTRLAVVSAVAGWGSPDWLPVQVSNSGMSGDTPVAWALDNDAPRFINTSVLARDVVVPSDIVGDRPMAYAPIGTFIVDPVNYSMAFNLRG